MAPDNSDYYFKPPNCEQNRKYSNLQERTYRTAVVEPTAALGDRFAPCPATVLWRSGEREVAKVGKGRDFAPLEPEPVNSWVHRSPKKCFEVSV